MINILRISNASQHTSAPLNSFTLARNSLYKDERTTFLVFNKHSIDAIQLYFETFKNIGETDRNRLKIVESNGNIFLFIQELIKWLVHYKNVSNSLIHMHQPRSAFVTCVLSFLLAPKIPKVYTVHNNIDNFSLIGKFSLLMTFYFSSKIIFVSKDASESFSSYKKFFKSKMMVIQNGVDLTRIDIFKGSQDPRNNEIVKFISTGRFTEQKNQFFLIDVFNSVKNDFNWTLSIFGSGEYADALQVKINQLKLQDRIWLCPTLPRNEIFCKYYEHDIYVSTALWEGLPVALMEAMACEKICFVSNIPSHIELSNTEGLFLIDFDVFSWRELILNSPSLIELKDRLGKENRALIENSHSMQFMMENYRRIYNELI
jgi:glycosyltransferase involved in cell wall biosynthesis